MLTYMDPRFDSKTSRFHFCPGEIDRDALGRIVFEDPTARRRLNAATHLPIAVKLASRVAWAWLCGVPVLVTRCLPCLLNA